MDLELEMKGKAVERGNNGEKGGGDGFMGVVTRRGKAKRVSSSVGGVDETEEVVREEDEGREMGCMRNFCRAVKTGGRGRSDGGRGNEKPGAMKKDVHSKKATPSEEKTVETGKKGRDNGKGRPVTRLKKAWMEERLPQKQRDKLARERGGSCWGQRRRSINAGATKVLESEGYQADNQSESESVKTGDKLGKRKKKLTPQEKERERGRQRRALAKAKENQDRQSEIPGGQTATGKRGKRLKNMTPEEREQARMRNRDRVRRRREMARQGLLSPEEQASVLAQIEKDRERKRLRRANLTPEQKKLEQQKIAMHRIQRRAKMTEEDKKQAQGRNYMRKQARLATLTPEEREVCKEKHRQRGRRDYHRKKQDADGLQKIREYRKKYYWELMPPELKVKFKEKLKNAYYQKVQEFKKNPEKYKQFRERQNMLRRQRFQKLKEMRVDPYKTCPQQQKVTKARKNADLSEEQKEKQRERTRMSRLRRKLAIQTMLDSGVTMEEIKQRTETAEQRERRLVQGRIRKARMTLRKKLIEVGTPVEIIEQKVAELNETYHCTKPFKSYKPCPERRKPLDPQIVAKLQEMEANQIRSLKQRGRRAKKLVLLQQQIFQQLEPELEALGTVTTITEPYSVQFEQQQQIQIQQVLPAQNPLSVEALTLLSSQIAPPQPTQSPPNASDNPVDQVVTEGNNYDVRDTTPLSKSPEFPVETEVIKDNCDSPGATTTTSQVAQQIFTSERKTNPKEEIRLGKCAPTAKTRVRHRDVVCDQCGEAYSQRSISIHKKQLHNPNYNLKSRTCLICGEHFKHAQRWYSHYLKCQKPLKSPEKTVICDECGQSFANNLNLNKHKHYQHGDGQKQDNFIKCQFCPDKQFKFSVNYNAHLKACHPNIDHGTKECYRCTQRFSTDQALAAHVKEIHPQSYFPCAYCSTCKFSQLALNFHLSKNCAKIVNQEKKELERKWKENHEYFTADRIPVPCELCGKSVLASSLTLHYQDMHKVTEDKCFLCGDCGKRFKTRAHWIIHLEEKHERRVEYMKEVAGKLNAQNRTGMIIKPVNRYYVGRSNRVVIKNGKGQEVRKKKRRKVRVICEEDEVKNCDNK